MPSFFAEPRPAHSPWGEIQTAEQLLPGIWTVTTSSHGGFLLSEQRHNAMPPCLGRADRHYEEDVDYALVVLAFEREFSAAGPINQLMVRGAHDTVRNWYPDQYSDHTGKPVAAKESHVLKMRDAYRERLGRPVVVSAFGSWADWVPAGKTGVIARTVTAVDQMGRPSYAADEHRALVDADKYDARGLVIALDELDPEPC